MNTTRQERLVKAFNYLRANGLAHTQRDVAARLGMQPSNLSSAMNGNERVLTDGFLHRFNVAYNNIFCYDWLLTGEGSMLADTSTAQGQSVIPATPAPQGNEVIEHLMEMNRELMAQNKMLMERVKLKSDQIYDLVTRMQDNMTQRFDKQDDDAKRDLQTALEQCSTVDITAIIERLQNTTN